MALNPNLIKRGQGGKFAGYAGGKNPPPSGAVTPPARPEEKDDGGKTNTIEGVYDRFRSAAQSQAQETKPGQESDFRIDGDYQIGNAKSEGTVGSEGEYAITQQAPPKRPPSLTRGSNEWHKFNVTVLRNPAMPGSELKAQMVAFAAHRGQTDQVGVDYIEHPAGVAKLMEQTDAYKGLTGAEQRAARQAAWLHDTLEDTAVNIDDLRDAGFDEDVITAVEAVTARKGEPKLEYYERVKAAGPVAVAVKLGDLSHNNLPERRENLPGSPSNPVPPESVGDPAVDRWTKLGRKYYIAYRALGSTPPPHLQQFAPI